MTAPEPTPTQPVNFGTSDRLRAEISANPDKSDHAPVTDSSLTYGDLRAMHKMYGVSGHKLADMLRDSEPCRQPDDGDTEMEITVEDARRIAWALIGHAPDRDRILQRLSDRQGSGANTSKDRPVRDEHASSPTTAGSAEGVKLLLTAIASCEGEQEHFEAWAIGQRYDMEEHPLHYLFMDQKTDAARAGWKAALHWVETLLALASPAPTQTGEGQ